MKYLASINRISKGITFMVRWKNAWHVARAPHAPGIVWPQTQESRGDVRGGIILLWYHIHISWILGLSGCTVAGAVHGVHMRIMA